MSSMSEFSPGGYIEGPPIRLRVERSDRCPRGHDLFMIDGGLPEHIIRHADLDNPQRAALLLGCQRELEEEQALTAD